MNFRTTVAITGLGARITKLEERLDNAIQKQLKAFEFRFTDVSKRLAELEDQVFDEPEVQSE